MRISGVSKRSVSTVLLSVAVAAAMLVPAGPAAAVTPPDPVVVPPALPARCDRAFPEEGPTGLNAPCLEIPIGGRVLNDVTARLIFWLPEGSSFAPGVPGGDARHIALVERFFHDLSGSQTYNILTQYHDSFPEFPSLASDLTRGYHPNRVRTATYVSTRPFPSAPLTIDAIEDEIERASDAAGWPLRDPSQRYRNAYIVFTPVGVQTCYPDPVDPSCSGVQWAGVHSWFGTSVDGSPVDCRRQISETCTPGAYAVIPTLDPAVLGHTPPFPNGGYIDTALDTTWHEFAETVSDPFGTGWFTVVPAPTPPRFNQVGDLCSPFFMPDRHGPRAADGSNVTLNGNPYLIQRIYSNAALGCTQAFHGQFINLRPLAAKTTASPPFLLTGDATSRLPVAYSASGPCTVSAATVTVTGVGSCTITANQPGDRSLGGFYHPAAPVAQTFAITQAPVGVTTSTLPSGRASVRYSASLSATHGVAPYAWTVQSGSLPPGLTLSTAGVISGTPTTTGTFNVVVRVTDASAPATTATKPLAITITNGPFRITTTSLPNATLGVPYSAAIRASDGIAPYKWKKLTKLPTGLKLNATTGVISGTPKKTRGTFSFTVQASYKTKAPKQPAVTHTATRTLSITVT